MTDEDIKVAANIYYLDCLERNATKASQEDFLNIFMHGAYFALKKKNAPKELCVVDIVKIKSKEWYNKIKEQYNGFIDTEYFSSSQSKFCDKSAVIIKKFDSYRYRINLDNGKDIWTISMFV